MTLFREYSLVETEKKITKKSSSNSDKVKKTKKDGLNDPVPQSQATPSGAEQAPDSFSISFSA